MRRSLVLCVTPLLAMLLAFVAPQKVAAQYGNYPNQPPPYQHYQPMPDIRDLEGAWYLAGRGDQSCQVVPSRQRDRALFINESGNRAEGYLRGNRIFVPRWGNLQGRFLGDTIQWSNGTVWLR